MTINRLSEAGFTLLETMIAMAIMMVAFASILMVESASINTTTKARTINVVAMLAKREMVETEYYIEGKTFEEVEKEKSENFKEPYSTYKWTRKIREIKFPSLSMGGGKEGGSSSGETGGVETMTKLLTNFLSKAVREVTVTITWKKGAGEQNFSVSTYWVDLNHEFALSE